MKKGISLQFTNRGDAVLRLPATPKKGAVNSAEPWQKHKEKSHSCKKGVAPGWKLSYNLIVKKWAYALR